MARDLHLTWKIDCMEDRNQKEKKETWRKHRKIREQGKNQKDYQFVK